MKDRLVRAIFLFLFIFLASTKGASAQTHPFLLMRSSDIPSLQSKSNQEPYSGMKTRAIAECTQRAFPPPCNGNLNTITGEYPSLGSDTYCMRAIMSACTLASIVDSGNRTTYINKVVDTLPRWEDILIIQTGVNDGTPAWSTGYLTDATAAYFNTVLAIDILHDDLAARPANISYPGLPTFTNQLAYAEFLMEQEFNHFWGYKKPNYNLQLKDGSTLDYNAAPNNYPPAREAALILWKLYSGTFSASDNDSRSLLFGGTIDNAQAPYPAQPLSGYMPEINPRVNDSGTYTEGPGYAYAAWGLDRDERSHLIDLLEFTGKDSEFGIDFYTNPKFIAFYEWLYGYASTPFGLMTSFGDTHAMRLLSDNGHGGNNWTTSSHIGQASKFGNLAGSYAAWKSDGAQQQGRLLNYLLYTQTNTTSRPQSKIFANGGGFFLSQPVDNMSLYGALWNVREHNLTSFFHVRKDVNALYLAGYGAPLLMNAGFCGAVDPSGPDGCSGVDENNVRTYFDGTYLGRRAVSNSVAMLNYTVGNYLTPNDDGVTTDFGSGVTEGFTGQGLDYVSADSGSFVTTGNHTRNFLLMHPTTNTRGYFVVFDEFSGVGGGNVNLVFHPNAISRTQITPLTEYSVQVFRRFQADVSTGLDFFFATPPSDVEFYRGVIASSSGGAIVPEYFFNTYPISNGVKNIATILFPFNNTHAKATMSRISGNGFTGAMLDHGSGTVDYVFESNGSSQISHGSSFQGKAAVFRMQNSNLASYFVRKGRSFSNGAGSPTGFNSNVDVSLYLNGRSGNIVSPGTSVTFRFPGLTAVRLNGAVVSPTQSGSGFLTVNVPSGTHAIELSTGPTPTGPTIVVPQTPGDANGDGRVDGIDYIIWLNHFNQSTNNGFRDGDFNADGTVNGSDFVIWVTSYSSQ